MPSRSRLGPKSKSMNSHIAITAQKNGKQIPLNLPDDFSIDIDDQNPLFNDNEMFSYPCRMPMEGNRFLLGNIDDPLNIDRPVGLEHTKMRIVVDNQPFRSGTLVTAEDEEIDGALTMNISASDHSIDDLIGDLKCQDIPLKDKILIGEKIGAVTAAINYQYHVHITWDGKKADTDTWPSATDSSEVVFTPQALGFSCPAECNTTGSKEEAIVASVINYDDGKKRNKPSIRQSFINVSEPYPNAKYCNARVAYYHYGLDEEGKKTSNKINPLTKRGGPENKWPYWVLDADRQQSGICFYVLYFLDCLFSYLGVSFDNSELLQVEDMRHLCFFTTHCKYDEEYKYPNQVPYFTTIEQINAWLTSRGTGAHFEFHDGGNRMVNNVDYIDSNGTRHHAEVGKDGVNTIMVESIVNSRSVSGNIMRMYANSENFPEESVKTVLDSLWASFGIRFEYDYEKKHVRAYYVREVFRDTQDPIDFPGRVISMHKIAEKITGVRMCYSAESSSKEQQGNVRSGKKDYDTSYDYIDYPQNATITDKHYEEIFRTPQQNNASGNTNVYVDRATGNKYRIKVNSDAETAMDLKPVLFEVGQYKGVELGDCSELNEDFIEEIKSDFVPMVFNDVNYQNEVNSAAGSMKSDGYQIILNADQEQPILAAFVDEEMEHEFLEQRIRQTLASNVAEFYFDEVLDGMIENYDPSSSDDGNSPLQTVDWGLAIAIMRGGGTDATIQTYDHNYDGFGNSKWRTVAGLYALTSDSLDMWGNEYDYNGVSPGIGGGERFSLKIRSWVQPEWANAPLVDADVVDSQGNIEKKIKSRGLFDTFMSEYANFILKRRKYRVRIECSAAQVADVPNHWTRRFRINGMVGFINKLSYNVSAKDGLNGLEVEFYVL